MDILHLVMGELVALSGSYLRATDRDYLKISRLPTVVNGLGTAGYTSGF